MKPMTTTIDEPVTASPTATTATVSVPKGAKMRRTSRFLTRTVIVFVSIFVVVGLIYSDLMDKRPKTVDPHDGNVCDEACAKECADICGSAEQMDVGSGKCVCTWDTDYARVLGITGLVSLLLCCVSVCSCHGGDNEHSLFLITTKDIVLEKQVPRDVVGAGGDGKYNVLA